jgi:transcription elongation factor GreA
MHFGPLIRTSKAPIEAPVMISQQRDHGGLVPLKALYAIGGEMDDQDVDHAEIPFSPTTRPGRGLTRHNAQMSTQENEGEPITEAGLEALKAEIGHLETVERRRVAARILTARGHGDLKENAEYHAAKEDQAHLETRILRLRQRRRNAVVVDVAESPGARFAFGQSAEVRDDETGELHTWTIVGGAEADRAQGKLSVESPVGKALLDHAAGATVEVPTPRGPRRLTIERIL